MFSLITKHQSSNIKQFSNDLKNPKSLFIDYCLLIITKLACLVIGAWLLVITFSIPVHAESLSVSLRVGDTRVQFMGFSSPGAVITIKQNNVVISTALSEINGDFDQTIDAYNPGLQTFELYSVDTLGHTTPTLTYNINALAGTLTTIGNIVFPPTIVLDPLTGTLTGYTHPLASITLILSTSATYPVTVSGDGSWSFDLNTLDSGDFTAYALATMPGNIISLESETISFSIAGIASSGPAVHIESPQATREMPGDAQQSGRPRRITVKPEHRITTTPTPSLTPTTLTLLFVTIARPILNISLLILLLILLLLIRMLFTKKKK